MCDPDTHDVYRCWCGARTECRTCGSVRGCWFRFGGYVFVGRADDADVPELRREIEPRGHTNDCINFHYSHLDTPDQLLSVSSSACRV